MNPTTRTPAARDWLLAAQAAALLDSILDGIDWGPYPYEYETRRSATEAARALSAIAEAAVEDAERRSDETARLLAELSAEKRADRRAEEQRETDQLLGGAAL